MSLDRSGFLIILLARIETAMPLYRMMPELGFKKARHLSVPLVLIKIIIKFCSVISCRGIVMDHMSAVVFLIMLQFAIISSEQTKQV